LAPPIVRAGPLARLRAQYRSDPALITDIRRLRASDATLLSSRGMDTQTFLGLVLPGLATGVGGLFLLVFRRPSAPALDGLLGFTAGVMLAATAFSLLVPALDRGALGEVLLGFALGAGLVLALDATLPHAHQRLRDGRAATLIEAPEGRRATLLISALTIHNIPEGLAVGVAFAAGGTELGLPLAIAIGVQNVPEGFAAAAPLLPMGVRPRRAALVALLTGLVEPPAALLAYFGFELISSLLAFGLSFAAGAMLYVIVDELVPESHGRGNERIASVCLLCGFALMLTLDNAF
jgi:ZIP family zinc transporter